jgi:hypothetical protein
MKFKLVIFIIPYHHIGGAERVHLNIIKALRHKPFVFFTNLSKKDKCTEFDDIAYCFRINSHKRRKASLFLLKALSKFLKFKVFGCNNIFFTK